MTWIKICGITNLEDAQAAVTAGANALGFVFYDKSPRNVNTRSAHDIVRQLPGTIEKIGVFPEHSMEDAVDLARQIGLTGVQLYPLMWRTASSNPALGTRDISMLWAMPADLLLRKGARWMHFASPRPEMIRVLLDSTTSQQPGGTGQAFEWARAARFIAEIKQQIDVVVAGGLQPTNVREAIRILQPWGVDVSSGVEVRAGRKDPDKIKAFIAAVRDCEQPD